MTARAVLLAVFLAAALSARATDALGAGASADSQALFVEGARLWPVYCAQCHNARPGSQFSPAQWDAITMHMRTQSIMPARDIRAIKEFLKQAR